MTTTGNRGALALSCCALAFSLATFVGTGAAGFMARDIHEAVWPKPQMIQSCKFTLRRDAAPGEPVEEQRSCRVGTMEQIRAWKAEDRERAFDDLADLVLRIAL